MRGGQMDVFGDEMHQSAHHDFVRWIDRNYDTGYVLKVRANRDVAHYL